MVGIGRQHLVVEANHAEADDEVRRLQLLDELVHGLLGVVVILAIGGRIGHRHREAQARDVVPASHLLEAPPGL